ncbi:hypothetical protein [Vineibacter terrae]|uniref:hypothetical protein n=1 Tax=Vineibacter terrae TaxID=2586908 RepID=UPI002E2F6868|nr:hypothetical protein [Vineibacter terrae]HEX2890375.1 hypothetical protein [Vineibacter terrae]
MHRRLLSIIHAAAQESPRRYADAELVKRIYGERRFTAGLTRLLEDGFVVRDGPAGTISLTAAGEHAALTGPGSRRPTKRRR